jgi:hypothetical protein
MPFNEIELHKIEKVVGGFCNDFIPAHARTQIKLFYTVRGYEVKIIESRSAYIKSRKWNDTFIARLKHDPKTMLWHLYWMRASGRWQVYPDLIPTKDLESLVNEIKNDPHRAFWG